MANTNTHLVGNTFKPGFRFQRYWDTSMAAAFFFAEAGSGLFAWSAYFDELSGMLLGLGTTLILKPYFHLAHMGVPAKSWRAIARPDRSWISRGVIAIGALAICGGAYCLDRATGLGLSVEASNALRWLAIAAAIGVMCYQGFAMSASSAFGLWSSALLPFASLAYAATIGALALSVLTGRPSVAEVEHGLRATIPMLLIVDALVVSGILWLARRKSAGGAFSVELLLRGRFAPAFVLWVYVIGLFVPLALTWAWGDWLWARAIATIGALVGFFAFRIYLFRAAVYEPITPNLVASLGFMR